MVLRKITTDNTVRYIPKSEQTRERDFKPNKIKNNSTPRKQNLNFSENNKSSLKIFQHNGSNILIEY